MIEFIFLAIGFSLLLLTSLLSAVGGMALFLIAAPFIWAAVWVKKGFYFLKNKLIRN